MNGHQMSEWRERGRTEECGPPSAVRRQSFVGTASFRHMAALIRYYKRTTWNPGIQKRSWAPTPCTYTHTHARAHAHKLRLSWQASSIRGVLARNVTGRWEEIRMISQVLHEYLRVQRVLGEVGCQRLDRTTYNKQGRPTLSFNYSFTP